MKCPVCASIDLLMAERQGVEIDYCPQCRGIWLDRGELDKIIELSTSTAARRGVEEPQRNYKDHDDHKKHDHDDHKKHDHDFKNGESHGQKRHKSWLREIMDFG